MPAFAGWFPRSRPLRYRSLVVFSLDLDDLRALLRTSAGADPLRIDPMPGGASSRKFFRVTMPQGRPTLVAMFVPDLARSDEIDKGGPVRRWSYLEVRDLLESCGVRVPALVADGTHCGWTVVEDLGDETVAEHLARHPERREAIYRRAVADLARAQTRLGALPADSIVRTRAFDFDLLRWEIEHFREWGLDARGQGLAPAALDEFHALADRLAHRVASLARGFVHRDYQSRNLMVLAATSGRVELAWVDFQDALMGPRVYDLVALLNDSYQQFDRSFVEARLAEYVAERGLGDRERAAVVREFDVVTVQRKLKDAGRFVFIDRVKGDPSYLRFVAPTLQKVRASLERLAGDADMARLREVLGERLEGG
jgi:aminoglycoside/choline kinase family phosphotransferase